MDENNRKSTEIIEVFSEEALASAAARCGSVLAFIENLRVFVSDAYADFAAAAQNGSPALPDFYCGFRACTLNLVRAAASAALGREREFAVIERLKGYIIDCRGRAAAAAAVLNEIYLNVLENDPRNSQGQLQIRAYASDANALAAKMDRTVSGIDAFIEKNGMRRSGSQCRAAEAASRVRVLYTEIIPAGHVYYPARPYPPEDIPLDESVPERPAAWECFRAVPEEELEYDSVHDEFVIPKGRVFETEYGRLDDQSVLFDWENETVTCGFVGAERTTWPFFKVKQPADLIAGRGYEYYFRKERRNR